MAIAVILAWALAGPVFRFSDTWQLVMNTTSAIVTFLMVFLIQSTQNRDARAMHMKLNELIRAIEKADNSVIALEEKPMEEVVHVAEAIKQAAEQIAEESAAYGSS